MRAGTLELLWGAVAMPQHLTSHCYTMTLVVVQVLLDSITGSTSQQQQQQQGGQSPVLQQLPSWLSGSRQDLERALARVAAGTAAPAEAVGLWTKLSQVCTTRGRLHNVL